MRMLDSDNRATRRHPLPSSKSEPSPPLLREAVANPRRNHLSGRAPGHHAVSDLRRLLRVSSEPSPPCPREATEPKPGTVVAERRTTAREARHGNRGDVGFLERTVRAEGLGLGTVARTSTVRISRVGENPRHLPRARRRRTGRSFKERDPPRAREPRRKRQPGTQPRWSVTPPHLPTRTA